MFSASCLTLIKYSRALFGSLSNVMFVPQYFGNANAPRLIHKAVWNKQNTPSQTE